MAVEFALVVPMLVLVMIAFVQIGTLFLANAGLQNALGEGARLATLWPRRTEAQIAAEIDASRFGLIPEQLGDPEFTYGNAAGQDFVEIRMTYDAELNFIFFNVPAVTLSHTRRAYLP